MKDKREVFSVSLRDYFAGQALVGWIANPKAHHNLDLTAKTCYLIADEMIKQREVKE